MSSVNSIFSEYESLQPNPIIFQWELRDEIHTINNEDIIYADYLIRDDNIGDVKSE